MVAVLAADTILIDGSAEGIPQAVPRAGHSLPPETVVLTPSQARRPHLSRLSHRPPCPRIRVVPQKEQDQNDEPEPCGFTPDVVDIEETPAQVETASQSSDEPSQTVDDSQKKRQLRPLNPMVSHRKPLTASDHSRNQPRSGSQLRTFRRSPHCFRNSSRLAGPCAWSGHQNGSMVAWVWPASHCPTGSGLFERTCLDGWMTSSGLKVWFDRALWISQ